MIAKELHRHPKPKNMLRVGGGISLAQGATAQYAG
jgi:hypothetical protein